MQNMHVRIPSNKMLQVLVIISLKVLCAKRDMRLCKSMLKMDTKRSKKKEEKEKKEKERCE
jgi:hypothetical protein